MDAKILRTMAAGERGGGEVALGCSASSRRRGGHYYDPRPTARLRGQDQGAARRRQGAAGGRASPEEAAVALGLRPHCEWQLCVAPIEALVTQLLASSIALLPLTTKHESRGEHRVPHPLAPHDGILLINAAANNLRLGDQEAAPRAVDLPSADLVPRKLAAAPQANEWTIWQAATSWFL